MDQQHLRIDYDDHAQYHQVSYKVSKSWVQNFKFPIFKR